MTAINVASRLEVHYCGAIETNQTVSLHYEMKSTGHSFEASQKISRWAE
jgi:hypothetical protein